MILSCQDIWVGGSIEFVLAFTFFFNRFCRMWLGMNIAYRLRFDYNRISTANIYEKSFDTPRRDPQWKTMDRYVNGFYILTHSVIVSML